MKAISRRQFLFISASLSMTSPFIYAIVAAGEERIGPGDRFPLTIAVLKTAYSVERKAAEIYEGYCRKAVEESFPNIAYLLKSFATSEGIHARNYKRLLSLLHAEIEETGFEYSISNTKTNLINASKNELLKIRETYPDYLVILQQESHDEAVVNCMYSWKSHQQHQHEITEIRKYSPLFFGTVSNRIENMKMDFHVCDICGSTIAEKPRTPCEICNYPYSHYRKINRPV